MTDSREIVPNVTAEQMLEILSHRDIARCCIGDKFAAEEQDAAIDTARKVIQSIARMAVLFQ